MAMLITSTVEICIQQLGRYLHPAIQFVLICKNKDSATEIITVGICMFKIFQYNVMSFGNSVHGG